MKTIGKSTWGGKRDGSGRKPKLRHEARELFYLAIDERWERILAKIDNYILRGDKDMVKFLIEQRIGKPGIYTADLDDGDRPQPILIKFSDEFESDHAIKQ